MRRADCKNWRNHRGSRLRAETQSPPTTGLDQEDGYNADEMPPLDIKIQITASNNRNPFKGISHHFFPRFIKP
jgi:hypothetical protein